MDTIIYGIQRYGQIKSSGQPMGCPLGRLSKYCHCEPVRTLAWQSVLPKSLDVTASIPPKPMFWNTDSHGRYAPSE